MQCPECHYEEERTFDRRELETEEELQAAINVVKCPNCEDATLEVVWKKAPSSHNTDDMNPGTIAKMKDSFKQRFVKKEIDDVRHKHGVNFDDALRSKAAQRIKKGEKPI